MNTNSSVSLYWLFKQFLLVGITAFGGYTALIAVVQKEIVDKHQLVNNTQILHFISVAALLPGPLAVNVIAYIGYRIKGWPGAVISMFAVLLPSLVLMLILAVGLEQFTEWGGLRSIIAGVIPVIIAIIFSVGTGLFAKRVKFSWQYILFFFAFVCLYFFKGYWMIFALMSVGGAVGFFLGKNHYESFTREFQHSILHLIVGVVFLLAAGTLVYISLDSIENRSLMTRFATVSLTLFGGGYVMIPLLFEMVVENLHWVTAAEFGTAIAVGQITPGPILISAAFIGFQVSGIVGAILATGAIFLPSAMLMIVFSEMLSFFGQVDWYRRLMQGVYPIVIALILHSCYTLISVQTNLVFSVIIAGISYILIKFVKINFLLLVIVMGVIGYLFYL